MKKVHIGTSGFYYSGWIGKFYPNDIKREDLFVYYSKHFSTVEINSSFYHLLRESTVQKWLSKVPDDFVFSLKASRYITHMKKLIYDQEAMDNYFNPLDVLAKRKTKSIIEFQLPPSLAINISKLEILLPKLSKNFLYAFEFRHESWFDEKVYELLRKYNIAIVLSDSPHILGKYKWPYHDIDTADFSYIRFHGSPLLFASSYGDSELKKYVKIIQEKKGDVYCYFNNDIQGHAVENAQQLGTLLNS